MPKVIPGLKERIIASARKRILESENHDFSTRELAEDCGVAAGTIYNYFRTREELLTSVMMEDWEDCIMTMEKLAERADGPDDGLRQMEDQLRRFTEKFRPVWQGHAAPSPGGEFHHRLIAQIEKPLSRLAERFDLSQDPEELKVATEILLAVSLQEKETLERVLPVMRKIMRAAK